MHEVIHRRVITELWFVAAAILWFPVGIIAIVTTSAALSFNPRRGSCPCGCHIWACRG